MGYGVNKKWFLVLALSLSLCGFAAAEEKKGGYVDDFGRYLKEFDEKAGATFFRLFPNLEESLNKTTESIDGFMPFMRDYHWVIYLLLFFVVVGLLIKVWEESSHYLVNSLLGLILLITCIHLLEMKINVTLFGLIITLILGVPGVLVILALHYLGVTV